MPKLRLNPGRTDGQTEGICHRLCAGGYAMFGCHTGSAATTAHTGVSSLHRRGGADLEELLRDAESLLLQVRLNCRALRSSASLWGRALHGTDVR